MKIDVFAKSRQEGEYRLILSCNGKSVTVPAAAMPYDDYYKQNEATIPVDDAGLDIAGEMSLSLPLKLKIFFWYCIINYDTGSR